MTRISNNGIKERLPIALILSIVLILVSVQGSGAFADTPETDTASAVIPIDSGENTNTPITQPPPEIDASLETKTESNRNTTAPSIGADKTEKAKRSLNTAADATIILTTYSNTDAKIAQLQSDLQSALDNAGLGNTVEVTGLLNAPTANIKIDIPVGVTLDWKGNYSGFLNGSITSGTGSRGEAKFIIENANLKFGAPGFVNNGTIYCTNGSSVNNSSIAYCPAKPVDIPFNLDLTFSENQTMRRSYYRMYMFSFTVATAGLYEISATQENNNGRPYLYLYDANWTNIGGSAVDKKTYDLKAGTYYFMINDNGNGTIPATPFRSKVSAKHLPSSWGDSGHISEAAFDSSDPRYAGYGTTEPGSDEAHPWLVRTAAELAWLHGDDGNNGYFYPGHKTWIKLDVPSKTLDLSAYPWLPIRIQGNGDSEMVSFDGADTTITGLNVTEPLWSDSFGLFGYLDYAEVSNLTIAAPRNFP